MVRNDSGSKQDYQEDRGVTVEGKRPAAWRISLPCPAGFSLLLICKLSRKREKLNGVRLLVFG